MVALQTMTGSRRPGAAAMAGLALGAAFLITTSYLLLQQAITPRGGSAAGGKGSPPVTVEALSRLTPGELNEEQDAAGKAFADNPLNAASIIDLSRIAEARGNTEAAERLKLIAGEMTPRLTRVQAEALAILLKRRDFDAVMTRLDGLIRARPSEASNFFALAGEIAADEDGAKAVARMLAANPPWRKQFIDALIAKGQAGVAYQLMGQLRSLGAPVDAAEIRAVIDSYLKQGDVDRGYAVWLSSLGEDELKDVRLIYDGGFSHPLRSLRFDWTVKPGEGLSYRLFPRNTASMDQTLQLDFADFAGPIANPSQILRLRPGRYRLTGEIRFENFVSPTGVVFRLYCIDTKLRPLDETSPLPQSTQWISFEKTFAVPAEGCANQLLQLESKTRLENTQLTRGMIAIDALNIDNLPALAP